MQGLCVLATRWDDRPFFRDPPPHRTVGSGRDKWWECASRNQVYHWKGGKDRHSGEQCWCYWSWCVILPSYQRWAGWAEVAPQARCWTMIWKRSRSTLISTRTRFSECRRQLLGIWLRGRAGWSSTLARLLVKCELLLSVSLAPILTTSVVQHHGMDCTAPLKQPFWVSAKSSRWSSSPSACRFSTSHLQQFPPILPRPGSHCWRSRRTRSGKSTLLIWFVESTHLKAKIRWTRTCLQRRWWSGLSRRAGLSMGTSR